LTQPGPGTELIDARAEFEVEPEPRPGRPPFRGILAWRPDAVSWLSLVVFFIFVLPARYVVKGAGAVGTPANGLGICLLLLWLFARMRGSKPATRFQPVRILTAIYLFVVVLTYATGFSRGMYPDETNNATRYVIQTFAMAGIALTAADAIHTRDRLHLLLQRVIYGAAFMGLAGDIEFVTGFNLAAHIRPPGLKLNSGLVGSAARGAADLHRVAGTASHYIEFGVVLAMLLPLAIHFAIFAPTRGRRQFNWLLVAIIGMGVPFAISRAAAFGLVAAMFVIGCCWTWRARVNAIVAGAIGAVVMKAAKPGLLGTIRNLFLHASSDPSVTSRTADYGPSFAMIRERPIFGRGAGTFIPSRYRFLDNQILMTTIESGFLGLAALVTLFVGGLAIAQRVGKFATDPETKHLGYALLAAFTVAFLTSFTFDSLSFPIFTTMLFLLLGVAGALWRLDRAARHARFTVDSIETDADLADERIYS